MSNDDSKPQRQEILAALKPALKETDLIVSALAGTTADTYQVIDRPGNLYLVGMGMVSQVALGLATALPNCRVFALDTDGSMLLAPSILPVIGTRQPKNLYIVVFDNEQLFGSRGGPKSQTATGTNIAGIAKASGMDGVVASPLEIGLIREACGPDFLIVTPGVRPSFASVDDQKRIMTPSEAVSSGADFLVIGRPIAKAADPVQAADRIASEIAEGAA